MNMPLDQTTQAKSGPAEVSSQMLAPSQLRKRSSTTAMREDERPQEAEHVQKRANTQISDHTTEIRSEMDNEMGDEMDDEMDDEMARMVQKYKEDTKKRIEDKILTKVWAQRKTRQRRTAFCCSCQKRTVTSKAYECQDCGHVLCAACKSG
jgi:hypothetical protein